jgi:exosome complex component RRP40
MSQKTIKSVLPGDDCTEIITATLPSHIQTTRLGAGLISTSLHTKRRRSEMIPSDIVTKESLSLSSSTTTTTTTTTTTSTTTISQNKEDLKNKEQDVDISRIFATLAGDLTFRPPDRFFILYQPKFYTPLVGDTVIGIVTEEKTSTTSSTSLQGVAAGGEGSGPEIAYKVRLQGSSIGLLPQLAFDGASKRNKPTLAVGAAVFCRVATVSKHLEPELSCCVVSGPRKEWMTGQAIFGELKGGTLLTVEISFARTLLDPECVLLAALGASLPFEMAVGLNGIVWINAKEIRHVIAITAAIMKCQFLSDDEQRRVIKRLKIAGALS